MKSLYVTALLLLLLALAGGGHLLTRLDMMHAEARALSAQQRLHAAQLERVRAELKLLESRPQLAVDEVARRRAVALRGALLALVRTGVVSMPNDPGGEWVTWR